MSAALLDSPDNLPAGPLVPCDGPGDGDEPDEFTRPLFDHDFGGGFTYTRTPDGRTVYSVPDTDCAHDEAASVKAAETWTLAGKCRRTADEFRERVTSLRARAAKEPGGGSLVLDGMAYGLEEGSWALDRLGGRES